METISGLKIQNTWAFQHGNWTFGKQHSFGSGNSKDLWESVGANQSNLVVGSEDVENRSWSSWRKNNNIIQ